MAGCLPAWPPGVDRAVSSMPSMATLGPMQQHGEGSQARELPHPSARSRGTEAWAFPWPVPLTSLWSGPIPATTSSTQALYSASSGPAWEPCGGQGHPIPSGRVKREVHPEVIVPAHRGQLALHPWGTTGKLHESPKPLPHHPADSGLTPRPADPSPPRCSGL